jgi:hypothetical protein
MQAMRTKVVTRFDAVRDQIGSAIRMFFVWDDLVSALMLAGAAQRVFVRFTAAGRNFWS